MQQITINGEQFPVQEAADVRSVEYHEFTASHRQGETSITFTDSSGDSITVSLRSLPGAADLLNDLAIFPSFLYANQIDSANGNGDYIEITSDSMLEHFMHLIAGIVEYRAEHWD